VRSRGYDFAQRVWAALRAISDRFSGVSLAALTAPPFRPPTRPLVCAADFGALGSVDSCTILWAIRLRSAIREA